MMHNPEIVPDTFRKAYWRNVKNFGMLAGADLIGGMCLNMMVTRLYPKFLILHTAVRLPLRLVILGVPFAASYFKLYSLYEASNDMVEEQFIKIQRFRKSGNIEEYFK